MLGLLGEDPVALAFGSGQQFGIATGIAIGSCELELRTIGLRQSRNLLRSATVEADEPARDPVLIVKF